MKIIIDHSLRKKKFFFFFGRERDGDEEEIKVKDEGI